jgi:Zn-finger nucleic acid-binding protein
MDFSCPTCDVLLEAQTLEDIRLWKCPSCRGIAISLPLVRKGLNSETFKKIWQKLSLGETRMGRSCPGCRNPLSVVEADVQDGEIMIDVCRTCHILWFDDKEFSDLPKAEQEKSLSTEAELAFAAFKADQYRRRSFFLKLLDNSDPKEFGLDSFFGDFFDE